MTADTTATITVTTVNNDGDGLSQFGSQEFSLAGEPWRQLSEQQTAENFRLRQSSADYSSNFHVAGDPTLLVILSGSVRITLRSGEYREFSSGAMFIAEDYLRTGVEFEADVHGHMASVVGGNSLSVLHLKLARRE